MVTDNLSAEMLLIFTYGSFKRPDGKLTLGNHTMTKHGNYLARVKAESQLAVTAHLLGMTWWKKILRKINTRVKKNKRVKKVLVF